MNQNDSQKTVADLLSEFNDSSGFISKSKINLSEQDAPKNLQDEVCKQMNREFGSYYIYFGLYSYFKSRALDGFAGFMKDAYEEELEHAGKFHDYLISINADVELEDIDKCSAKFASAVAATKAAYDHECVMSRNIGKLYNQAKEEGDDRLAVFLQAFVDEQRDEEQKTYDLWTRTKLAGDGAGLLTLDHDLKEDLEEVKESLDEKASALSLAVFATTMTKIPFQTGEDRIHTIRVSTKNICKDAILQGDPEDENNKIYDFLRLGIIKLLKQAVDKQEGNPSAE